MSFLGHWHPMVRAGTLEGTEKGPNEVTVGVREREKRAGGLSVFKEGRVLWLCENGTEKNPVA